MIPVVDTACRMWLTTDKFEGNPKVWQQAWLQETVASPVSLEKGNRVNDRNIKWDSDF